MSRAKPPCRPPKLEPLGRLASACRVAAITWRLRSSSVSSTATSVRPGRPPSLAGGLIRASSSASPASARAGRGSRRRAHRAAPRRTPASAFAAQPVRSLPITEWPVNGTTSSWASGIRAATRRRSRSACAGPARRRRSASARSGAAPAAAAAAMRRARRRRLRRGSASAVAASNGREVRGGLGVQERERFREPGRCGCARAARGTAPPRRSW